MAHDRPCRQWANYCKGIASLLLQAGVALLGLDMVIACDIPSGGGLSSSAAIEVGYALTFLAGCRQGDSMDRVELALLCRQAEHTFAGTPCGIMDQYISRIGRENHAVKIDCTDLSTQAIPINTPGYSWLLIDSNKRRGLVDSEYNRRRKECEEGLKYAQSAFTERNINGLRDISVDDLNVLNKSCDETVFSRVKHIVTENDRVLKTVQALETGDIDAVGKNLYASHVSLRDDFEVSCEELDMLVKILSEVDGTTGTNDIPGRIVFGTTADGAASPTERMRIDSGGNVGINETNPNSKLDINGTLNAGVATLTDITVNTPSNIYNLSHDLFADYIANEHKDWTNASDNFKTTGDVEAGLLRHGQESLEIGVAGDITISKSYVEIDVSDGAGASDDLDNIDGGVKGDIIVIKSKDSTRDIVVKHLTGNIHTQGVDRTLANRFYRITLQYDGAFWVMVSKNF